MPASKKASNCQVLCYNNPDWRALERERKEKEKEREKSNNYKRERIPPDNTYR
jgi:hypothetical protein